MKEFVLDIFTDQLVINVSDEGAGTLVSRLDRETCPSCSQADCAVSCDGSQGADENNEETEQDVAARLTYNACLDAVEAVVLAHACAGINVSEPAYVTGIKTALEAIDNNLG